MAFHFPSRAPVAATAVLIAVPVWADDSTVTVLDTLFVEADTHISFDSQYVAPSSVITAEEADSINVTTTEDLLKYEPNIVVRRRYIGDSNGVVGIRGSNMFQTARTLVYADGLPLHYLLETRWNGAPRWGLVAADETEAVEVIYGPFSAEYSGNAMGGVVNITTKEPEEREFRAEAAMFLQDFDDYGADDTYFGHREFLSYGDRFDDVSLYLFHNHLDNDGQPQSFRSRNISTPVGGETPVTGAISGLNSVGDSVIWVGDTGTARSVSDLTKLKVGYDLGEWTSRFTLAFEDRDWETRPDNYLRDAGGNTIWQGAAVYEGQAFSVNPAHFAISDQNRQSVLIGVGAEGPLGNSGWSLDTTLSWFDVIKDETRSSDRNPDDPAYTPAGSVTEYDDTGWVTFDVKLRNEQFLGRDELSLIAGYHFDHYSLNVDSYDSTDYRSGDKTTRTRSTGGETRTHALFAQLGWDFAPQWDIAIGARYENWKTLDGYYYRYNTSSFADFDNRTETGFSPKLSLGFDPVSPWSFRYSLAKAYRFPIVEELYHNADSVLGTSIADETLEPELGIHHNLMIEREIERGFARVNLYHEVIDDAIWNQTDYTASPTVSTYLPVDQVRTTGIELVVQQDEIFDSDIDIRFNVAYTDSEITENDADPSVEGNVFPRMPRWRAGLLGTWHVTPRWDTSLGFRFASDSYGNLDNSDEIDQVYGAQDRYLFIDLKANYQITDNANIAFGIDNVTDEVAYVAHPWPQRTFYLQGSVEF